MGTSSSSNGPGAGVPMVPPWADATPGNGGEESDKQPDNDDSPQTPASPTPVAPASRFGSARTNIGSFARSGSRTDMQRGVGQYISKGYGGSSTATRRFGGTTRTAASLAGALSSGARGASGGTHIDIEHLRGKSANEIMDAIVEAVRPIDGTQDAEASRESIKDALCELLENRPNTDLLELDDDARYAVVESFIAADVYRRIFLDIGKKIQEKSPNAATGLKRLHQVKDYVRETVKSSFSKLKGVNLASKAITDISKQALHATFQVFEEYAR